jgi:hypothetical protein
MQFVIVALTFKYWNFATFPISICIMIKSQLTSVVVRCKTGKVLNPGQAWVAGRDIVLGMGASVCWSESGMLLLIAAIHRYVGSARGPDKTQLWDIRKQFKELNNSGNSGKIPRRREKILKLIRLHLLQYIHTLSNRFQLTFNSEEALL